MQDSWFDNRENTQSALLLTPELQKEKGFVWNRKDILDTFSYFKFIIFYQFDNAEYN